MSRSMDSSDRDALSVPRYMHESGNQQGSQQEGKDSGHHFRVLGIAMVVDQVGIGPRMVLRYPAAVEDDELDQKGNSTAAADDIFFRLTARQMAKLFRPKRTLCRQPLTLSVGGTVFCCRAILMGEDESSGSSSNNNNNESINNSSSPDVSENDLALFSVIVAMTPQIQMSSIPISGWFEYDDEDRLDPLAGQGQNQQLQQSLSNASVSFLCVRRVHVSLARLCRVLEREERRCRYVSIQSKMFGQIRNDMHEQQKSSANGCKSSSTQATSNSSATERSRRHHKRGSSFDHDSFLFDNSNDGEEAQDYHQREQEILEIIMASPPPSTPKDGNGARKHQGNLAAEIVHVYHALSRNDHDFSPTPSVLLTGRDGVVHINRHIAVSIEAVSPSRSLYAEGRPDVRPYQTLLFPHASPRQLLESLSAPVSSGTAVAPRRLQQLLLVVNPQKSLHEVAVDANLHLQTTLEIAAYLVGQGCCLASPVVSRTSRLACRRIERIPEVSLAFSQAFGVTINVFLLVSFLTRNGRTLGDTMAALRSSNSDADAQYLRESIFPAVATSPPFLGDEFSNSPARPKQEMTRQSEELEELLYQMAVWLCSHRVLIPLQEYLIDATACSAGTGRAVTSSTGTDATSSDDNSEKKVDSSSLRCFDGTAVTDDFVLKELVNADCLKGKTSIQACAWKIGLDTAQLRSFAARNAQIRIIYRIPMPGDDWVPQ